MPFLFDCLEKVNTYNAMADPATQVTEEPTKEISLTLGSQGTAFTVGLIAGAVAGVVAVICILNYARK